MSGARVMGGDSCVCYTQARRAPWNRHLDARDKIAIYDSGGVELTHVRRDYCSIGCSVASMFCNTLKFATSPVMPILSTAFGD